MVRKEVSEYKGSELELFKSASNWKNYFSSFLKAHITGSVADVGSGIGTNYEYLVNAHVDKWTFIEPDAFLMSKVAVSYSTTVKHKGFLLDIDSRNKFDTIIYIDVLEHIRETGPELTIAVDRLNDNGKLIILVPAYNFLFSRFDYQCGHYRRYNKSSLINAVNHLDLQICEVRYLDTIGVLTSLVNKFILKQECPTKHQILFWDKKLIPFSIKIDTFMKHSFGRSLYGIFKKQSGKI